jgi:hypothetical protein
MIGFIELLQNVTTNNYDSLTELHTPKITVTTADMKSSQSFLAITWELLPTVDAPCTLDYRNVPNLSYSKS